MTVNIYEIPGEKNSFTAEEVENYLNGSQGTVFATVTTEKKAGITTYTAATKDDEEKLGQVKQGYTYLAVETGSTADYPIVKEDSRVIWYGSAYFQVGDRGTKTITLTNLKQERTLDLRKTTETQEIPSLYEQGSTISYTLTPTVTNNHALHSFVLTDEGLTAYGTEGQTLNEYLNEKYSVTSIVLNGPVSHDVTNYTNEETAVTSNAITATVTFYDFNGQPVGNSQEFIMGGNTSTEVYPVTEGDSTKIKSVKIEYVAKGFQEATGGKYGLGEDFTPGTVTVNVDLEKQDGGMDGENAKAVIKKIENKAKAELIYYPWNENGTETLDTLAVSSNSVISSTVADEKFPVIAVTKTTSPTAALRGTQEYTITIENTGSKSMVDPVIVDLLPQGVSVNTNNNDFAVLKEGTGLSIGARTAPQFGEDTAVILELNGELEPQEKAVVTLKVTVGEGVVGRGNDMRNYVFVTSKQPGIVNEENIDGKAFKVKTNETEADWANSLVEVAGEVADDTTLEDRITALEEELGDQGISDNGYAYDYVDSSWLGDSKLTLHKEIKKVGDSVGYQSDRTVNVNPKEGEKVSYRLSVTNTSDTENRTDLKILDLLPQKGDFMSGGTSRESAWNLELEEISSVLVEGRPVDYKIYYYTGAVTETTYSGIYEAVKTASYTNIPKGWTDVKPGKSDIKAFIIAVNPDTVLEKNDQLTIEYTATVKDYSETDLANITYMSALNNFVAHYSSYPATGDPSTAQAADDWMQSNPVSAAIQPEDTMVGGRIWIDANADGIQNDEKTESGFSYYWGFDIVKQMLSNITITLRRTTSTTPGKDVVFETGGIQGPFTPRSCSRIYFFGIDSGEALEPGRRLYRTG